MPGTSIQIDKRELTYLLIRFTYPYRNMLQDGFKYLSSYIINLEINGETKINNSIEYSQDPGDPLKGPIHFTDRITLEYVTVVLDPVVYNISITWVSTSACTHTFIPMISEIASVLQCWVGSFQCNRTLLVQEIFI